jgi:hypothetical protein
MPDQESVQLHSEEQSFYEGHFTEQPGRPIGVDMSQDEELNEVRSVTPIMWQVRQIKLGEQRMHENANATVQQAQKPGLFKRLVELIAGDPEKHLLTPRLLTERDLIRLESEIGRTLFGPIPAGHKREFFCLDERTWIWHEEWKDNLADKRKMLTIRYEVHQSGVLKVQENQPYKFVEGQELKNLAVAAHLYFERTMTGIYERDPATGQKLALTPDTISVST